MINSKCNDDKLPNVIRKQKENNTISDTVNTLSSLLCNMGMAINDIEQIYE